MKRQAGPFGRWFKQVAMVKATRKAGRVLGVILVGTPSACTAAAVEAREADIMDGGLQGFFDKHAHAIIVQDVPYKKARAAAETHLLRWKRSVKPLAECGCGEIEPPAPPPSRKSLARAPSPRSKKTAA